jgi:hypothetical protein
VGDPVDGDGPRAGGAVVGDPAGAGELLVDVGEGLGVCDGLGERVGWGEVEVGVDAWVVGEVLPTDWLDPELAGVTGRTR